MLRVESGYLFSYPFCSGVIHEKKLLAAYDLLGSDLEWLTSIFLQVIARHRRFRDTLQRDLRTALAETAACLPVYRTYALPYENQLSEQDRLYIHQAIAAAKTYHPEIDPELFDFLQALLTLEIRGEIENELTTRFQQYSGPVMAKGVEDTTFYLYHRLVSLNEVGGNPGRFGFSAEEFHAACQETQEKYPYAMLATSTHDTKRSEDARARLNVLTALPERWAQVVRRWAEGNQRHHNELVDRNTEYMLYQNMVGTWPISEERLQTFAQKAAREAKANTSWRDPNAAYESALHDFIHAVYADTRFMADMAAFVETIEQAGRINSLSQTALKLTTPGIPDLYQGSELWNLDLVDPDNRRTVDYDLRRKLLAELDEHIQPEDILARMDEGLPKLWLIQKILAMRKELPEVFSADSSYTPLSITASGSEAGGLAFLRGAAQGAQVVVVIQRFPFKRADRGAQAMVSLPPGRWRSIFCEQVFSAGGNPLAGFFTRFPVAVLVKEA